MECKKCGTVYDSDFCPNCGNPTKSTKVKKPIYKKWWFWVIIAILFISVISSSGDKEETPVDNNQNITATASGNADNNQTQATQSTTQTEAATQTEAVVKNDDKHYVGDVINANGLNITYVSAETWESDNMFMQPEDGYTYIRLKISAENKSSVDRYISSFEFECYADGKKESSTYVGDEIFEGGNLSAGRSAEGYIYFTVPVDAESIEVEYETSFWTDRKAIFVVDLAG